MEFVKHFEHHGLHQDLHFYRDGRGVEVDLLLEHSGGPGGIGLVEIKSGQTYHEEFAASLRRVTAVLGPRVQRKMVVYGGDGAYLRSDVEVVGLQH